jgi:hypothetical protein
MRQRSDPAGALYEVVGVARIASLKNQFNASKHLARTPGIDNFAAGHLHFDPKVTFDSGDRIDHDSLIRHM